MRLKLDRIPSPIGTVLLVSDDAGLLYSLDFDDYESRMKRLLDRYYGDVELRFGEAPSAIVNALNRYFDGDLVALKEIVTARCGTDFQRDVWAGLRDIPVGATVTYGQLAAQIGRPSASRAVGLANGANPVAIVVPCHRVIGANGKLTGFGAGIWRKQWLLHHEGALDCQTESQHDRQPLLV